jgi:hypothetical protein
MTVRLNVQPIGSHLTIVARLERQLDGILRKADGVAKALERARERALRSQRKEHA